MAENNTVFQVTVPKTRDMQERDRVNREKMLYGRKLSEGERRLLAVREAQHEDAERKKAAADADAWAWRRREYYDAGAQAEAQMLQGMNPLVWAGMLGPGGLPTTAWHALRSAGVTVGTLAGLEAMSNDHPDLARWTQRALTVIGMVGVSLEAKKILGGVLNDVIKEPTEQKVNLLYEMLRSNRKSASQETSAEITSRILDIHHRRPQVPHEPRPVPGAAQGGAPAPLPRAPQARHEPRPVPAAAQGGAPVPRPRVPQGELTRALGGARPARVPAADRGLPAWLDRFYRGADSADPFVPVDLEAAFSRRLGEIKSSDWFRDLKSRFGDAEAEKMARTVASPDFYRYMFGDDPARAIRDFEQYSRVNRMIRDMVEPNEIVVGGSAGISQDGTIVRNDAIPHDVDFSGYIANASRAPLPEQPPLPGSDYLTRMAAALSSRENIENAPIIQKLRRLYPELKDAKFRYSQYDWQIGGGRQYTPGVFTVPKVSPSFTKEGHGNMLVTTMINGEKVDLMLSDGLIHTSKSSPVHGAAETAFAWKRQYGRERASGLRAKDLADIRDYLEYGEDNRFFDTATGRGQFAAAKFADDLITAEGLPVVSEIEAYPGGPKIPVMMNREGIMIEADNPYWLQLFNPEHPLNKYAGSRADASTHPVVAIRTLATSDPSKLNWAGEPSPSVGLFRADDPEAVASIILGRGNPVTGKPHPVKVYPRSAVDPEASPANRLQGNNGYTGYVWEETPFGSSQQQRDELFQLRRSAAATPSPENLGRLGRRYMEMQRKLFEHHNYVPETGELYTPDFRKIDAAFREYVYDQPLSGWYAAEAKRAGYVPDPDLIDPGDPAAHAKLVERIRALRFAAPLGVGAAGLLLQEDTDTQQDAKGGNTRSDTKGDKAAETFDTPIPEELRAKYDAWYAQLPKNLQYTGDYDLQGAWLEKLGQPDKYEATQNGHLDDYGKKPNHITFSTGSKWHDPKVPERTGGEWRQAKDGSWDFYPGTGNKASDDELKAYFDKYEKGNRVHRREVRQDALGGDAGSETAVSETPVSEAPQNPGGPRIVVNPQVFRDKRDALCVAFNEAFRLVMEENGFEPVSEPTEKQRKFFADTAYANDELQLRRTILARIATLDTSVSDPTDEQLEETAEMLEMVMEVGAPQNEWEQQAVQRLHDVVTKAREGHVQDEGEPLPPPR